MKIGAGIRPVFFIQKDQPYLPGSQLHIGEYPFFGIVLGVRKAISLEIDGLGSCILNFNPIRPIPIFVHHRKLVIQHVFIDDNAGLRDRFGKIGRGIGCAFIFCARRGNGIIEIASVVCTAIRDVGGHGAHLQSLYGNVLRCGENQGFAIRGDFETGPEYTVGI